MANRHSYLYIFVLISFGACIWCHQYQFHWCHSSMQRCDMLIDWLEQRLEYTQRKRLRKLIHNLIKIVYVNALFAFITLIMLLPFIILFCRAITLQDQLAIAMHHPTDASDPTAVHQPVLRDVYILDV